MLMLEVEATLLETFEEGVHVWVLEVGEARMERTISVDRRVPGVAELFSLLCGWDIQSCSLSG